MPEQAQTIGNKQKTVYIVNSVITIALMLAFWFATPAEPLTVAGIRILGIVAGAIYGWCTVGLVWPSFLALVLLGLSGFVNGDAVFTMAGGQRTTLYILFLLFFAGMFTTTKVAQNIAQRIITAKIARGKPWTLTLLVMLAAFVPSIVIGGVAGTLIVWSFVYAICEEAGLEKGSKWPGIMILFVAVVSTFGHNVLPFQVSNAATFGVLSAIDPSYVLPYPQFILLALIYSGISLVVFYFFIRFVLKPDVKKLLNYENTKPIQPFDSAQKLALVLFGILFVLLMLPGIAKDTVIGGVLNTLGNSGIVLLVTAVGLLVRKNGKPIIDFLQMANTVPWHVMMMIACALCLSGTFNSPDSGINVWLTELVTPLFAGRSPMFIAVSILLAGLVLTNILNNAVVSYLLTPILYSFKDILGETMTMSTMIIFMFLNNMAFLLASGSTHGALLAGQREWIPTGQFFKYCGIAVALVFLLALVTFGLANVIL